MAQGLQQIKNRIKAAGVRARAGVAFLLLILITFSWLLLFYKLPGDKSFLHASLQNAGHTLSFLIMSFAISLILSKLFLVRKYFHIVITTQILCLFFGGAVELIQGQIGREASWFDFLLDFVGTSAGLFLFLALCSSSWKRVAAFVGFIALLLVGLKEPLKWTIAEHQRSAEFPTIIDFENAWANKFVSGAFKARLSVVKAPKAWQFNDSLVGKLRFVPGSWPGMTIKDVHSDWRGYQSFTFEVLNPSDDVFRLVVRVHDKHHNNRHNDRFNHTFNLKPGLQQIRIPLSSIHSAPSEREMDLANIDTVMFYSYKTQDERTLYFDNIRLQ